MGEVLKSFLVMLGFSVDKKSSQNFAKSLKDAEKQILDFKDVVTGVLTGAVVTGIYNQITAVADKFDGLGDTVNRIGNTSVKDLASFSYAVQLLGGDAATAQQSYETLSRSIGQAALGIGRAAPVFEQLGISARDASGNVKTVDAIWAELSAHLQGMGRAEQAAIIQRLGMSADMVESLTTEAEAFNALRQEYLGMYSAAGFSFDEVVEASAEFNDALDKLKFQVAAVRDVIGAQFLMEFRKQFESVRSYVSSNMNEIAQSISAVIKVIITAGKVVMVFTKGIISASLIIFKIFNEFLDWFSELSTVWKVGCAAMLTAWLLLQKGILKSPLGRLFALAAVLGLLIDDFKTFQRGGKSYLDWGNGLLKFVSQFVSENQKLSIAILLLLTNLSKVVWAGRTLTRLLKSAPIAVRSFTGILRSVAGGLGKLRNFLLLFSKTAIPIVVKGLSLLGKGVMALATKVIPALLLGLKSLSVALLTTPIGWIILAITALIAIGVLLYKNWDTIKEYLINAWESIKDAVSNAIESIKAKWEELKGWFASTWEDITGTLQGYLDNIKQTWDNFIDYLAGAPDRIKAAFVSFLDWLSTVIPNAIGAIGDTAKSWWNGLVDSLPLPEGMAEGLKLDSEPKTFDEREYEPQRFEDTLSPQEWDAMERARAAGIDDPRWAMLEQERGMYSLRQAPLLEGQETANFGQSLGATLPNLDAMAMAPQLMQPAANPSIVNNTSSNTSNNITNNSDYNITINAARNPQETANAVYNKLNGSGSLERNNMRLMQ